MPCESLSYSGSPPGWHEYGARLYFDGEYDFLRLFRFFVPHGRLWTGIEDFFYWIYAAVMTFLLLFYENSGIVRAYIIACVFFGMIFYDKIISRNVFQLLKKLKKWYKIKR